ncbi:MAG: hypothetical protein A2V77_19180 [Anaeromyxobacter sp. RBG_16_69_14]|nr:MAG: hypothetical protein A2V77_19180 [Anaeromyxobacter sp. RBG_16_69_14]
MKGLPTVLVIEDNSTIRKLFRITLAAEGYAVLEAGDGRAAIELFGRCQPALVVQDLLLPDIDGLELVRRLRTLPRGDEVPILACSGMLSKLDEARLLSGGFNDFLLKPVELSRLVQAVQAHVPIESPSQTEKRGRRVLVVDDEPVRRKQVATRLALNGFEVESAVDGLEALATARLSPPDAIASDVILPNLDGFGLCLAVRRDLELARVPVVLYTAGYQEEADRELSRRVGANAMIAPAGDLRPLVTAIVEGIEKGAPSPPPDDVELADQQRLHRAIRQLERQVALYAGITRRYAAQGADLSFLAGIAEALAGSGDVNAALGEVLGRCLEAVDASLGALFSDGASGLALSVRAGSPDLPDSELRAWLGCDGLFERTFREGRSVSLPSPEEPSGDDLLTRAQVRSALLLPVVSAGRSMGVLLLGSSVRDLSEADTRHFATSVAAQIGQALAVARHHAAAEEAVRKRDEFLAMLSHELRNPLAPIRNSLYILDRAVTGGEQAKRAQAVIDRQVGHMTRLIDDLLDVTRIARGKVHLKRERIDVQALTIRSAEDYQELFDKAGLELEVHLADEPLFVNADRTRLTQIIGNLLHNAVKFTPKGTRTTVSVRRTDDRFAEITVRDDGPGIAPDVLAHLFEPFVQAEKTLDRSAGGLGLGLALVKGFVELHGGSVSAQSAGTGHGTTFVVRIPVERRKVPRLPDVPGPPVQFPAQRVLVIEDNLDAAQTMKEALELNDHVVELAYTGTEGLEKARTFRPDVVLCDIGLPGMNGFEVARAMRTDADHDLRSVTLIALTGYAHPEDIEQAKSAGFDLHLAKPPDLEALERCMGGVGPPMSGT